ncbi:hypothetical protein MMC22_002927 [Lobaria immixta]|nr:hypothetical protein [Lobaria immixta]
MAKRLPDQRLSVRRSLEAHQASINFLTQEFSLDVITSVAKELLQEGIFESTSRAKLRFPELFETTPAQNLERAASEAEVARSEAAAIEKAIELSDQEIATTKPATAAAAEGKSFLGSKKPEANGVATVAGIDAERTKTATSIIPSLYPIYMPYALQHRILTSIQSLLEECCFNFGKRWLPDIIASEGWEVPEQVELTMWTAKLKQHAKKIPADAAFKIPGKSWEEVLFGTHVLRHSAVHRLKTSAYGLVNLIEGAVLLTRMLKDIPRAQRIEEIRDTLKSSIEEMERHKKVLQEKLSSEVQSIARQRAELDALEKMSINGMVQSDTDNKFATGQWLTECLFSSRARLQIESGDREASSPTKSISSEEKNEKPEKSGSITQQSSSLWNTNVQGLPEDLEHAGGASGMAQSSSSPKIAAKDDQNDHVDDDNLLHSISC